MKLLLLSIACVTCLFLHAQDKPPADTSKPSGTDTLQHVTVTSVIKNTAASRAIGMDVISLKETEHIPVFMGERDVLKTMQLLPGIKSAGDGNSGFYVRGGSADQNLILLDGTPVYNASHLLGFFSTFNGDATKELSFYKGAIPAQYGGRLSSAIDAVTNDGNMEQTHVSGGVGIIAARVNAEGPIQKNKSSFLVSARRTYADMFVKLSKDSAIRNNDLNFYDLNLKFNFIAGPNDVIYVSGYKGHDVMQIGTTFGLRWGNTVGSVHWKHAFSRLWSSHASLHYTNYDYTTSTLLADEQASIYSRIKDYTVRGELLYTPDARQEIRIGGQATYHTMIPSVIKAGERSGINNQEQDKRFSFDDAFYINHDWKLGDKIKLFYGIRMSAFMILGNGDFYKVDNNGTITDTIHTRSGEVVKTYVNAEPRGAFTYQFNSRHLVSIAYSRNAQHLHLISNATSNNPTDKWVANTNIIQPELADLFSIGYTWRMATRYELSVETYYKSLQHQLDYRNGADIFSNDPIETKLLFGKGRAYGTEWLLKKKTGKLTGWLAYTLSKTERKIDGINNNQWYNARQDRTHEIAVVAMLQLSAKWVLSGTWVYYTGNAVTFPAGKYTLMNGRLAYYYTERNGYRMPAYHRLDLAASVQLHKSARYTANLHFGLYNVYGRDNAYSIYFRESKTNPDYTEAVQLTLFRFLPSVTYNVNF